MVKSTKENNMEMEMMLLFKQIVHHLKRIADNQEELVKMQRESQTLVNELASLGAHTEWHKEP